MQKITGVRNLGTEKSAKKHMKTYEEKQTLRSWFSEVSGNEYLQIYTYSFGMPRKIASIQHI